MEPMDIALLFFCLCLNEPFVVLVSFVPGVWGKGYFPRYLPEVVFLRWPVPENSLVYEGPNEELLSHAASSKEITKLISSSSETSSFVGTLAVYFQSRNTAQNRCPLSMDGGRYGCKASIP